MRDEQWERIKDLLPGRYGSVGVTARDNRLFVEVVLYRYRAGIPWRDLPETFGHFRKVQTRYRRWCQKGVWLKVWSTLAQDAEARICHDRVQQAAYTLIPEAQRAAVHLKIGRLLLRSTPIEQQEQKLFAIANQLNQGIPLIADPQEQLQLAQFNLQAGRKARAATAYQAAGDYFSTGRSLLPPHESKL